MEFLFYFWNPTVKKKRKGKIKIWMVSPKMKGCFKVILIMGHFDVMLTLSFIMQIRLLYEKILTNIRFMRDINIDLYWGG